MLLKINTKKKTFFFFDLEKMTDILKKNNFLMNIHIFLVHLKKEEI